MARNDAALAIDNQLVLVKCTPAAPCCFFAGADSLDWPNLCIPSAEKQELLPLPPPP
jgi:hypothetical protein